MLPPGRIRILGLLLAMALALRLALIGVHAGRPLVGDERSYDDVALNVATGHGYEVGRTEGLRRPTAVRGPAYVLMLAAFYKAFGHRPTVPLVAQAFMDALCVALVYGIGRLWFHPPAVALLAAATYALYPPFIISAASLLTEPITHLTILLSVWWFFRYVQGGRLRELAASAASIGVCALSKPQLAPVGAVLCLAAIRPLGMARALRSAAIAVAVVLLVMSPWIVRNAVVFHTFIPGVSLGGLGLWFGAGPIAGRTIGGLDAPGVPDSLRQKLGRMSEVEASRWGAEQARRIILADPAHYARLSVKKFFRLWFNLGFDDVRPSRASLMVALFNLAALGLAVLGARLGRPSPASAACLLLLGLFWTAVNLPFFTVVRYAYPYLALLFIFSSAGVVALVRPEDPAQGAHARRAV